MTSAIRICAEAALGADVRLVGEMVPRLREFLTQARAAGLRSIFARTLHSPWTDSEVWLKRGGGRYAQTPVRVCLLRTWGAEFYAGVEPRTSADLDPANHDYAIVFLSDCTAASNAEKHAEALQRVGSWATVASSAEVVQAWRSWGVLHTPSVV